MKIVIVGGVAGGATAAARIRRLDEQAEIIIFERSGFVSYANCGLPYYVGGVIGDKKELTLQTPESFSRRFRIDVRVRHEVIFADVKEKTVTVRDLENGREFKEKYDKLLLSPGAKPVCPWPSALDIPQVFTLRTVEDTLRIREFIEAKRPRSAVLAGGGFIGLEMAENLRELGIAVTLVQSLPQVLPPLDPDMAAQVHTLLRSHGIDLMLGHKVDGFKQDGDQVLTMIDGGQPLRSDMVLLAIGVAPDTSLAREAGLELGIKDAIVVNDRMETSVEDIYAVGDAVQLRHYVSEQPALIALAGPANKQGRIAADNICGGDSRYKGAQGSSVIKLFDITAASTGLNEAGAKAAGIEYDKIVLSPNSHAAYYPGGKAMTMKLLFAVEDLRILGAQIVGYDGVDKRIDVLATAIRCVMKGPELAELDLAYAPPYSSAKDPVNMAGYIIENIASGRMKQFHWHDIEKLPRDGSVILLDTRTLAEYGRGHAEGFINIPLDELRMRLNELDKALPVYVMCQSGLRSYLASRILMQNGFDAYNFSGGYRFFEMVFGDKMACSDIYPCGMER